MQQVRPTAESFATPSGEENQEFFSADWWVSRIISAFPL